MSKTKQAPINPGMLHHHFSHGEGPHVTGHDVPGNLARDGAGKRQHSIEVHTGMATQTNVKGVRAFGADHRSGIDAISGNAVVPGAVKSAPGYGNAGVQSGHPFAKPPVSKKLSPPKVSWSDGKDEGHGMRNRSGSKDHLAIGEAILREAVQAADTATARAYGRDHYTGAKLPTTTRED